MKQSRVVWMGLLLVASLALAAGVWAWMARPVFATDVDVILSEVMFNTACGAYGASGVCSDGADETQFEWIEIYNAGTTGVDLSGWHVCDETQACSALSGTIPAGEYWVIAHNNDAPNYDLQSEFDHYTATVDAAKTIFLNGPIAGDGLVDGDAVYLKTAGSTCGPGSSLPCVSDCVSWDTVNTCANLVDDVALAYLPGADGFDSTALTSGEGEGQSIVNIQGVWYQAGPLIDQDNQASPYASNVAEGGVPPTDVDAILSEVMFNTACGAYGASGVCSDGTDETQFEWIEIYNMGTTGIDLSGWHVCDETQRCSVLSGTIPGGDYWVIAHNNEAPNYDLQSEFDNYTATVDVAKTIFVHEPIAGDGLVDGDTVYLKTAGSTCGPGSSLPCVSDCVSWDAVNTCANIVNDVLLAYLPGADGFDSTALTSGEGEGQSIVNIQGTWYQAGPLSGQDNQASPYAGNVAEGGTPTAILFSSLRSGAGGPVLVVAVGGAMVAALALRRRRAR